MSNPLIKTVIQNNTTGHVTTNAKNVTVNNTKDENGNDGFIIQYNNSNGLQGNLLDASKFKELTKAEEKSPILQALLDAIAEAKEENDNNESSKNTTTDNSKKIKNINIAQIIANIKKQFSNEEEE